MTFEQLVHEIEKTPLPMEGSVPTYVHIPLEQAKLLANMHVLLQTVRTMITEVRDERRRLTETIETLQNMPQKSPK